MIAIGIYHGHFNHISRDKLTTHESFASVSDFSVIYQIYCTNDFTYQSNCYSMSIHCKAIIIFIA